MGTSVASEPLNFFIIVICVLLLIVFSSPFLTAPFEMVALTTADLLHDFT